MIYYCHIKNSVLYRQRNYMFEPVGCACASQPYVKNLLLLPDLYQIVLTDIFNVIKPDIVRTAHLGQVIEIVPNYSSHESIIIKDTHIKLNSITIQYEHYSKRSLEEVLCS